MCEELKSEIVKNLIKWVASNKLLVNAITLENLAKLFVTDSGDQITVDLTKFNNDYYNRVFAGEKADKNEDEFIRKVCIIIRDTLEAEKKCDWKLVFAIKKKITITHIRRFIHPHFDMPATIQK